MTPEAELLLMNASRAQLVREVIRPALTDGEIVLCDRFYDSTTVYQGYGRQLDLQMVRNIVDVAVGDTRPDLTLLFIVPQEVSEARRLARQPTLPLPFKRDRIEEAGQKFFARVAEGYQAIAAAEPQRVRLFDATGDVAGIQAAIWDLVEPLIARLKPVKH
jgi:dTMP kinase